MLPTGIVKRDERVNYSKVAQAIRMAIELNQAEFAKFLEWMRKEGKL